ncbi:MAG: 16S rRNA (guanine(527)-N(7))-methyltransferase RsmG [Coriobacteriia bacterium]|nr:16S rRNA (guanine(527)-N(7))-methyltransferase RsmG [Actinomycetota bacterium]MDZ4167502.1 16S rRNA (guanine(527)-N(7))-methyltransferase RsmG [Coriobacteriia bacterium]
MKPTTDDILAPSSVIAAAERVECRLNEAEAASITRHALMMLDANKYVNLTRITEPEAVLRLHIMDSLAWLQHVAPVHGPLVDIGSGAGYPGVPLAIALGIHTVLCESVQKKAKYLRDVLLEIDCSAEVYAGRAEELAVERGPFAETVVARAVAPVASLVELAAPLLMVGGRLIALKGALTGGEVELGKRAAEFCGLELAGASSYVLPGGDEMRATVEFVKARGPRIKLPRQPGKAQREPLGGRQEKNMADREE